jgi:hypothetical protein
MLRRECMRGEYFRGERKENGLGFLIDNRK